MKKVLIFSFGFFFTISFGLVILAYFSNKKIAVAPEIKEIDSISAAELGSPLPTPYVIYEPLTLDRIFENDSTVKKEGTVELVATGDIIPARVTNAKMKSNGIDYPFEKIDSLLKRGDLTVVNLEAPLLDRCEVTLEGMNFCGPATFAQALKRHGVGLVTLENNHIGNHGQAGVIETMQHLESAGIPFSRFDAPYVTTLKGTVFGFLSVNGVGAPINRALLTERIKLLRPLVDVVVVSIHWGREYTYDPLSAPGIAPDDPQEIGHLMIDRGADLVIGNHPHWVQGVELYKEGFIAYGHGNFIFDQEWSQETKEGVVGSYIFNKGKLVAVHYSPVIIENYAQPREASVDEGRNILENMRLSSIKIRNR